MKLAVLVARNTGLVSLPSRERGLKLGNVREKLAGGQSLPSRERGLKPARQSAPLGAAWSLPSRERGLKRHGFYRFAGRKQVAPFTGAWIETPQNGRTGGISGVAPVTGAGIETRATRAPAKCSRASLPSRERGLKREDVADWWTSRHVAPFTGAWIETPGRWWRWLPLRCRSLHGSVD